MLNKQRVVKFILVAIVYLLWVLWMDNFWWLIGLVVVFDLFVTRKVNWSFWKKRSIEDGQHSKFIEWLDAIIFAVIAAVVIRLFFIEAYTIPTSSMEKSMLVGDYLFVSKVSYGPKMPNTPLAVPFVHHTLPLTKGTPAFSTAIQRPYKRLAGLSDIDRGDVIVFNFPEGDTVLVDYPNSVYYDAVLTPRDRARVESGDYGDIVYRPVDKRENYIKRCIAIAGDSIQVIDGQVFVNGEKGENPEEFQYNYRILTEGRAINPKVFERLDIAKADVMQNGSLYQIPLTNEMVSELKKIKSITSITRIKRQGTEVGIFPRGTDYGWNADNIGPIWIPQKGVTVALTLENLPLYKRVISVYENNELEVKGGDIYINGEKSSEYCFKMDYYWAMGDNRHNSADSRYWGFVPEDHMVGKAVFIWLSLDKEKSFPMNIRWRRLLSFVK